MLIRDSFVFLILAVGSARALDLTPRFGERDLEGSRIPIIRFSDGTRGVSYLPPDKWRVSGGEGELSLFPPNSTGCSVKLSVRPRPPGSRENPDSQDELKKWVLNLLPADAEEVAVLAEKDSPFMLGPLGSRELVFSYVYRGARFARSVAVVDLSDQQRFIVVVDARPEDFEHIHKETIASMFSWQWDN